MFPVRRLHFLKLELYLTETNFNKFSGIFLRYYQKYNDNDIQKKKLYILTQEANIQILFQQNEHN